MARWRLHLVPLLLVTTASGALAASYVVTNAGDSASGSLRAALSAAASNPGPHTITFSPSMAGQTIQPLTPLPALSTAGTEINGDIDGDGDPDVAIDGSLTAGDLSSVGLQVGADDCTIQGLVVNSFWWYQIDAGPGLRTTVRGCYINTDLNGTAPRVRANGEGVEIGESDLLGTPGRRGRNVICQGASCGVRVFGRGAVIRNNLIGVKATGDSPFYPTPTATGLAIGAG
jgi:hypothetical protein